MNFLRFPMFQRGGNVAPAMSLPKEISRKPYQSDSQNGPWERIPPGTEATKRYVLYAFEPPSQPRPAPLWKQMQEAYSSVNATVYAVGGCDEVVAQGYSAEIQAVAEWLELSNASLCSLGDVPTVNSEDRIRSMERKRLCNLLKEQARLAREGNA